MAMRTPGVPWIVAIFVATSGCAQGASDVGSADAGEDGISPLDSEANDGHSGEDVETDSSVPADATVGLDSGSPDSTAANDGRAKDADTDTGQPRDSGAAADTSEPVDSSAPIDSGPKPDGSVPITFVQLSSIVTSVSATSLSFTFPAAQNAGDLIVLAVGWTDNTSIVTSVADTAGNTYAKAVGPTSFGVDLSQSLYYASGIKAAASNKVTVMFNASASAIDLRAAEYGGLSTTAPLDVTATASGTSVAASSGAATTTSPRELLFGAGMTTDIFTAGGTGFTVRIVTPNGNLLEDEIVSATGSYSAGGTESISAGWVMQLATFR